MNVKATVSLLEALKQAGDPCHVLLASSGYVYGPTEPGRPAREGDALSPIGAYAESKVAMESAVAAFGDLDGPLRLTAARAFNHTGRRQNTKFVVPAFARQIARIELGLEAPIVRVGNLASRRDFLDVLDVVHAYRLLSKATPDQARPRLRVVNVCSGSAVTMRSILDQLVSLSRTPVSVESAEVDPGSLQTLDIPESAGNPELLSALTGWSRVIPLEQTIADTLDWWRSVEAPRKS